MEFAYLIPTHRHHPRGRETETQRERDRDTHTETQRETERQRQQDSDRQRERQRDGDRQRENHRETWVSGEGWVVDRKRLIKIQRSITIAKCIIIVIAKKKDSASGGCSTMHILQHGFCTGPCSGSAGLESIQHPGSSWTQSGSLKPASTTVMVSGGNPFSAVRQLRALQPVSSSILQIMYFVFCVQVCISHELYACHGGGIPQV